MTFKDNGSYSKLSLEFDIALESLVGSNGAIAEIAPELSLYFGITASITSVFVRRTHYIHYDF